MASPNPSPVAQITPNDGKIWRGLVNYTESTITVNVTVESVYGEQTYDILLQGGMSTGNVCKVNSASATVYGWPNA